MTEENPLKASIAQRLEEERYKIPREKRERKPFNFQFIIILSILLGLLFTAIGIIRYFMQ